MWHSIKTVPSVINSPNLELVNSLVFGYSKSIPLELAKALKVEDLTPKLKLSIPSFFP